MDFNQQPTNPATGQPWDPATEIFPGGPHPGAIQAMNQQQAEEAARMEAEVERREGERTALLLLL